MAALKAKYRQLTELMFLVSRPNYRDDIFTFINYLKTTKQRENNACMTF